MPFRKTYLKYDPENENPHFTVDISGKREGAGAVFSTRQVMNVVGPDGTERRGFYSANSYIDPESIFNEQIANSKTNWDNFRPLRHLVSPSRLAEGELADDFDHLLAPGDGTELKSFSDIGNALLRKNRRQLGVMQGRINDTFSYLESLGLPEKMRQSYEQDPEFWYALDDLNLSLRKAQKLPNAHAKIQMQSRGGNINLRNNAMSDYAEALGMPNILARSVPMTLVRDGVVSHGSFMDTAKGVSVDDLNVNNPRFKNRELLFTGDVIRQASNMQVLDFLSGNIDRHSGNLFYRIDRSVPGQARLVGLQGIDNDASFGTVDYKGKGLNSRMSRLKDIKVIDDETARRVLAMKPADVEKKIRLAGLSAEEIAAAKERLAVLQERITSGGVKRITTPAQWNSYLNTDLYRTLCSTKQVTVKGKQTTHSNIFQMLANVSAKYTSQRDPRSFSKREYPDGKQVTDNAKYGLWNRIDQLQRLQADFDKNSAALHGLHADLADQQLKQTLDTMKKCYGKESLSDDDREKITRQLDWLGRNASRYAQKLKESMASLPRRADADKKLYRAAVNSANNLVAFADDLTARLNPRPENALTEPLLTTNHTYASLTARERQVTGTFRGGSKEFADLRKSLYRVQGLDGNTQVTAERKRELYDNLADAAEKYLEYKVPDGEKPGMSQFARNRVQFARDVLEFAEAKLDPLVKADALAALTPKAKRVEEMQKNPYTPVVKGEGNALEYDLVHNTFTRFDTSEADAQTEYQLRMAIRNGGNVAVGSREIEQLAKLNEGKDLEKFFADYNAAAQKVAEEQLAGQEKTAAEYEKNRAVKNRPAPQQKSPAPRQKSPASLATIVEEGPSDEEMRQEYEDAYKTIATDGHTAKEYREAVMTVAAYHELYRFEQDNQILSEEDAKRRQENAALREKYLDDPDAYKNYKESLYKTTRLALGGKEEDFLRKTVKALRGVGKDPENRFDREELLANVRESAMLARQPLAKDADFVKGQKYLDEQRKKAYGMLASPSEQVKDNARLTIVAAHALAADSTAGKLAVGLWSGKRRPEDLSTDTMKAVNSYISAVKNIGKDPAAFNARRESTRRALAPYLSAPKGPGKSATADIEQNCIRMQKPGFTLQERYSMEERLVSGIKEQAAKIVPKPGAVEEYLARFDPMQKKAAAPKQPVAPKKPIPPERRPRPKLPTRPDLAKKQNTLGT